MEVTFQRTGRRRYAVVIDRPGAPPLVMHPAPGYDPLMPHDLAHFIVEREAGIPYGVFGQLAAGGDAATFHRVDGVVDRKLRRRGERLLRENRDNLTRSEQLVRRCVDAWKRGVRPAADHEVERVCASFDAASEQWRGLAEGDSITLAWQKRPVSRRRASRADARDRKQTSRKGAGRRRAVRRG